MAICQAKMAVFIFREKRYKKLLFQWLLERVRRFGTLNKCEEQLGLSKFFYFCPQTSNNLIHSMKKLSALLMLACVLTLGINQVFAQDSNEDSTQNAMTEETDSASTDSADAAATTEEDTAEEEDAEKLMRLDTKY